MRLKCNLQTFPFLFFRVFFFNDSRGDYLTGAACCVTCAINICAVATLRNYKFRIFATDVILVKDLHEFAWEIATSLLAKGPHQVPSEIQNCVNPF